MPHSTRQSGRTLHAVLARQLKRAGLRADAPPADQEGWGTFLAAVSRAYTEADRDRSLIQRSFTLSSNEMRELHESLQRRNAELEQSRVTADAASAAKSRFLANMSHEIRTPLNAIVGFIDLALDAATHPDQRREYAETVRRNTAHLQSLIGDILDISKIEAGEFRMESHPVALLQIIRDAAALQGERARSRGLDFELHIDPSVPPQICSDDGRIRQVIHNLLTNAIKFTQSGSVTLSVSASPFDGSGRCRVEFTVTDSGIGMTPEEISRLFRPFTQADESTTRRFGGTGLGLAISARIAQLLSGGITVASTPGDGSVFTFYMDAGGAAWTLPENSGAFIPTADTFRGLTGRRILIVDDGPDNRRLLKHHLSKARAATSEAQNGLEAVERVQTAAAGPDAIELVLLDMQMPVMDGYEAAVRLKQLGCSAPVIALTAHAMQDDRKKCLDAGCDDFLTKPIDKAEFIAKCQYWLWVFDNSTIGRPKPGAHLPAATMPGSASPHAGSRPDRGIASLP